MPPQQPYSAPAQYPNQSYPSNQFPNNSGPQQFGSPQQNNPQYNSPQPNGPQLNGPQPYGPPQPQQYGQPQAPAAYQGQPVGYQAPQQNGSFNGRPPTAPSNFQGPVKQKWNNAGPANGSAPPPFQRQQRNYSDSSNPSGAPVFQGQQQHSRNASQQSNHRAPALSNGNKQQQAPKQAQTTKPAPAAQSKASSGANTPRGERESTASSAAKETNPRPANAAKPSSGKANEESREVSEAAEAQQFEWDLEKIFKSPTPHEIVALAQPLSHDFDLTPVPQLNPEATCISRYAIKDNVKEFTGSVRDPPDWPSRQEDPVHAELKLDSPLIPLDEILAWTEARHAAQNGGTDTLMNDDVDASRKRFRSREASEVLGDGQNDADTQTDLENGLEDNSTSQPNKRQKTESGENANGRAGTPEMTTMFYETRDGTPCLATDDEAWAPQPGESAAPPAPTDPMEALLASLGVTGSPKPVDDRPLPPYQPLPEHSSRPISSGTNPSPLKKQPLTLIPGHQSKFQGKVAPAINGQGNMQGSQQQFRPTPPTANSQNHHPQFGPSNNGLPFQPQFPPSGPSVQTPYQNGAPSNGQYGMPQNGPPSYGGNNMRGNQQNGNSMYSNNNNMPGPPQNGNPMYGNNMPGPPQNGNPMYNQNMPGPPQNGNPMYGQNMPGPGYQQANNHQFGPPVNPPYFNGNAPNAPYGPGPQNQPPQYELGPNQNNNNNFNGQQQPMQPPQLNNGPPNQYPNGPQGNPQFNNQFNQQQYGPNVQNNAPFRQDSGYASAGGFSNGSAPNNFSDQQNPQAQSQQMQMQMPPPQKSHDGLPSNTMNGHQSTNANMNNETRLEPSKETPNGEENATPPPNENASDREDSPLSDNSKDILGLLETKKKKGPKRPAPIIEAAYSRRW